jgi:peptidyl-prolyl isomerase G (cyclophilin G)
LIKGKHVVFGKVIRGYEVVSKLADIEVDEKHCPSVPIVISKCGELELHRRPSGPPEGHHHILFVSSYLTCYHLTAKSRKRSKSISDEEDKDIRRKRRTKRRSLSEHKATNKSPLLFPEKIVKDGDTGPIQETEEEYDARLEREEKERVEAGRKKELELIKKKYEDDLKNLNGVQFKGMCIRIMSEDFC